MRRWGPGGGPAPLVISNRAGEVQDFQALVREQNFDDVQQAYLLRALKLTADWSILGAARYSLECICTLGCVPLSCSSSHPDVTLIFLSQSSHSVTFISISYVRSSSAKKTYSGDFHSYFPPFP